MTERGASDGMEITSTALLSALADGYTLENRGTGWWLAEKRVPYKRTKTMLVPDAVVDELQCSGAIRLEMPYNCLRAILTGNAEAGRIDGQGEKL